MKEAVKCNVLPACLLPYNNAVAKAGKEIPMSGSCWLYLSKISRHSSPFGRDTCYGIFPTWKYHIREGEYNVGFFSYHVKQMRSENAQEW